MKAIEKVALSSHVMIRGTKTAELHTSAGITLERIEDGVNASFLEQRNGKQVRQTLWVPDDNIVAVHFAPEEMKPEAPKAEAKPEVKK